MMRHSKSKVGMALFGGIIELYEDLFFERISMEKSTMELLNQGMKCLVNGMGLVDAERFVAAVMREKFDYTKWQRDYFDKKSPEQLHTEAVQYAEEHPYKGKAKIIL